MEEKKNKKKGGKLLIVIMVICFAIAAFAAYNLISMQLAYKKGQDEYEKLREYTSVVSTPEETTEEKTEEDAADEEKKDLVPCPISIDSKSLLAINKDYIGWLYVEGESSINYPLVHSSDNDYYLHRSLEGEDLFSGTLFIDYMNNTDFSDPNTIIYGHNMRDRSMFGNLKFLYYNEDYKTSEYFWIITPEKTLRYRIFSMQICRYDSDVYTLFMAPGENVKEYIEARAAESYVDTLVAEGASADSKVVTLSTCSANDDERFVVQGILVQEAENE